MKNFNLKLKIIFFTILLFGFLGLAKNSQAANYPLEIIQPRAGLNTLNRFYKSYPGLVYNVRMAVIGGVYPYTYSLTTYPSGMTINSATGEINWPNPTTSGSPHSVTARVVDSESTVATVSWTITVTNTGFKFLDAVNGKSVANGGTGTFVNPWKNIIDFYGIGDTRNDRTYAGQFIYFRSGTYGLDNIFRTEGNTNVTFVNGNKPYVWLAYPGENVTIDLSYASIFDYNYSDIYIQGFDINVNGNAIQRGLSLNGSDTNVVIRKNTFHGITGGYDGGNNALVAIFAGDPANPGKYWALQENIAYNVNTGYWVMGYTVDRVLVENNTLYNIGGHGISPKESSTMWFIRGNVLHDMPGNSINDQYADTRGPSGNSEISFNLVKAGGGIVKINANQTVTGYPEYIFRNTFMGPNVQVFQVRSTNGPFYFYNNVIVNETTYQDKIQRIAIYDPSRLVVQNNLTGSAVDNITDSNGLLIGSYSGYLGVRGWQLADGSTPWNPISSDTTPPASPTGLSVI